MSVNYKELNLLVANIVKMGPHLQLIILYSSFWAQCTRVSKITATTNRNVSVGRVEIIVLYTIFI